MKVILAVVTSIDGRTTYGNEPGSNWASVEDQAKFHTLLAQSKVVVMGSNTYREIKSRQKLSPTTLRIIMTHEPEVFNGDVVPGQREFTSESPKELVARLDSQGYKELLLVSGEKLSFAFLAEHLVDELWVTVEPILFGAGNGITTEPPQAVKLELQSSEKLNDKGTLLLKYRIF